MFLRISSFILLVSLACAGPAPGLMADLKADLKAGSPRGVQDITFSHVSAEPGFTFTNVSCFLQDRKGFVWFGTRRGLARYDAYSYRMWRHNPRNTNSLSDDDILSLLQSRNGDIWIGTRNGGLDRADAVGGRIERYTNDSSDANSISPGAVRSLCEDHL